MRDLDLAERFFARWGSLAVLVTRLLPVVRTFIAVPGETPELKARFAARVEALEIVGEVGAPSLPGAVKPKTGAPQAWKQARVRLSWPLEVIGPSLPNLVATISGNLFELKAFSGLKILDIALPSAFATRYAGPKFGIEGTRKLAGVYGRPIIGTIIKPSVGLDPATTAAMVEDLAAGGIDFHLLGAGNPMQFGFVAAFHAQLADMLGALVFGGKAGGFDALVNKSSTTWRQLPENRKAPGSEAEWKLLLREHPQLVRRPVVVQGDGGFSQGFSDNGFKKLFGKG